MDHAVVRVFPTRLRFAVERFLEPRLHVLLERSERDQDVRAVLGFRRSELFGGKIAGAKPIVRPQRRNREHSGEREGDAEVTHHAVQHLHT